ncbi:hypothetical protein ACFYNO_32590 [Kitasatospora sp. NPDC006697]|uniref:hypothetical protein n=1 Tax=Kitasatospora sp. NPDC006697 TaxID=3364020 RepID=UPI0036A0F685
MQPHPSPPPTHPQTGRPEHPARRPAEPITFVSELGSAWLDVQRLSPAELEQVARHPVVEQLRPVWVRYGRRWLPSVLTGWCALGAGRWAARVQHGPDAEPVWLRHRGASLQPILPIEQGLPPGDLTDLSRSARRTGRNG